MPFARITGWLFNAFRFRSDPDRRPQVRATITPDPHSELPGAQASVAKQAIVLIHGMGEQIPMDTIRGFVTAAWEQDPVITANGLPAPAKTWSKPDDRTGSLELRRITTRPSKPTDEHPGGVRNDFYELYWADLTAGSTWDQFVSWVWYLLLRRQIPRDVLLAWLVLWALTLLVVTIGLIGFIPEAIWKEEAPDWLPQKAMIAVFAAAGVALHKLVSRSFGRVVRYTRAQPDNIAARANVRARGLALLRALHDASYDRIIIVGHSLGTILGYDLLSYLWAEMAEARTVAEGTAAFEALRQVERCAARIDRESQGNHAPSVEALSAYDDARNTLRRALATRADLAATDRWLVSDLVTFGSPLSHAEFLLAANKCDLDMRQRSRELPVSPPYRESLDPNVRAAAVQAGLIAATADDQDSRLTCFPEHIGNGRWTLHHAAPFAAVRWTNVFDPSRAVVFGDLISGPVRPAFGAAIKEIDLAVRDRKSWRFTHTRYWALNQPRPRVSAFREAINLYDADRAVEGVTFGFTPKKD